MKNKYGFLLVFCFLISTICSGQAKFAPKNLIPNPYSIDTIKFEYERYKEKAYRLIKNLPNGYKKDIQNDYTAYLQKGINKHAIVVLPDFPILINDNGLTLHSGTVLLFQPNSKLILKSSSKETYEIIRIHGVNNVKIFNANIQGDANRHKGDKGEWGMGIAVRSSQDVDIYNATIRYCWGDGIYVGTLVEKVNGKGHWVGPSVNIDIFNAYIDGNRRNGLSLVSVRNCRIYNSIFANSRGTFPKAGIDIEPLDYAKGIDIKDVVTYNNAQDGIVIALVGLVKFKDNLRRVSIKIDHHEDFFSSMGMRISGYRKFSKSNGYKPLEGFIQIANSEWRNNPYGSLVIQSNQSLAPAINFINNIAEQRGGSLLLKGGSLRSLSTVKKGVSSSSKIVFH